MKKIAALAGKTAILLACICIILLIAAAVYVRTAHFSARIEAIVRRELPKAIHGNIDFDSIVLAFPPAATVYGLEMQHRDTATPEIACRKLTATLALFPLLSKKLVFPRVSASGLDVLLDMSASPNLVGLFVRQDSAAVQPRQQSGDSPVSVFIRRISIDSSAFTFRDAGSTVDIRLEKLAIRGTLKNTSTIDARLDCRSAVAVIGSLTIHSDSVGTVAHVTGAGTSLARTAIVFSDGGRFSGALTIPYSSDSAWHADVDLNADSSLITALPFLPAQLTIGKTLALSVLLDGPLQQPQISLEANVTACRYRTLNIDTIHATSQYDTSGNLSLDVRVRSRHIAGSVTASAAAPGLLTQPRLQSYTVETAFDINDAGKLFNAANSPVTFTGGSGSVSAAMSGPSFTAFPSHAELSIAMQSLFGNNKRLPGLLVKGSLKTDSIAVHGNFGDNLVLNASGMLDLSRLNARATVALQEPGLISHLFPPLPMNGTMHGTADFSGTPAAPQVQVSLRGDSLTWPGITCDSIDASLSIQDGKVNLDTAALALHGTLDSLLSVSGTGGSGIFSADIAASGPPDSLQSTAGIRVDSLSIYGFAADKMIANVRHTAPGITVPSFELSRENTRISGSLEYELYRKSGRALLAVSSADTQKSIRQGGTIEAAFSTGADSLDGLLSLDNIPVSALRPWLPINASPRGRIALRCTVANTMQNPKADLAFHISELGYENERRLGAIDGTAVLADSLCTATCSVGMAGIQQPLRITALLPFLPSNNWVFDLQHPEKPVIRIAANRMDLSSFSGTYLRDAAMTGILDADIAARYATGEWVPEGRVELSGSSLDFPSQNCAIDAINFVATAHENAAGAADRFRIIMALTTGRISCADIMLDRATVNGTVTKRRAVLDSAGIYYRSGKAVAQGMLPFTGIDSLMKNPKASLQASLTSFPLQLLNPSVQGLAFSSGTISGNLTVTPGESKPEVSGSWSIDSTIIAFDGISPPAGPLFARARLSGDSLVLHKLHSSWGDGSLSGQGAMKLEAGFPAKLALNGYDIPLTVGEEIELVLDTLQSTYSGTFDSSRINGMVVLGPSYIYREISLLAASTAQLDSSKKTSTAGPRLDMSLIIPDNLETRVDIEGGINQASSSIDMLLGGDFHLGGTARTPVYSGQLSVGEGSATYLDRKFTVTEGYARQPTSRKINPLLSVNATAEASDYATGNDYTVFLTLSGDLDSQSIRLVSEPSLPEPQIISLLTFGTTDPGAGDREQLARNRASAIANKSISTIASRYATRAAQEFFDIDKVEIDRTASENTKETGTTVTVSKRVGRNKNITVTYSGKLGDPEDQKAIVSWKVYKFLYVEGETDAEGNAGVDLKIKIRK
ncbi:MAG: hypothetical protein GF350_10000 [Chitinivibrionales bacterium]|nr:hypothetical protein [Chitinivibrionales bacterium]